MSELGLGREGMATLCSIFGMPPPSAQSSCDMHSKTISTALKVVLEKEYATSSMRFRQCLGEDDSNVSLQSDNIIDVVVSFDGTWHHRGFKSSQDVGVVISVDTGEILNAEIVSNTCEACQRSVLDKTFVDFQNWQEQHKKGNCFCNFDGLNAGMETAAAKAIWSSQYERISVRIPLHHN